MIRIIYLIVILCIFLFSSGCSKDAKTEDTGDKAIPTQKTTDNPEPTSTDVPIPTTIPSSTFMYISENQILPEIDEKNKEWLNAFLSPDSDLTSLYIENALLFPGKEGYLQGNIELEDYYREKAESFLITKYTVDFRIQLTENQDMVYEIGNFTTDIGDTYQYLTIWTKESEGWKRELDALSLKDVNITTDPLIDTARKNWVTLANAHSAITLVEELYSKNLFYYNRRNLYTDAQSLAQVYSYMNSEDFNIDLKPDVLYMLQTDLAYEIGTWSAGGTGKYIILWVLEEGVWKVRLDVNW